MKATRSTRLSVLVFLAVLFASFLAQPADAHAYSPAVEQWRDLVAQYDDWDVDTALQVIECESHGDPGVWNRQGSGAHGLFQLLGWEGQAFKMYGVWSVADPTVNVGVAHYIWKASGHRWSAGMGWAASAFCHGAW